MPKHQTLGDRCKFFEKNFGNGSYLFNTIPTLARIDGRNFHTFCKKLKKPYDERLSFLMMETAKYVMREAEAIWCFVQSDEISLCWLAERNDTQIFFDGKVQKMVSQLSALATRFFNKNLAEKIPEKADNEVLFDARVWNVPSKEDALAYAQWRQIDATTNAVSMAAHSQFSAKELHGVGSNNMQEMLWQKGINFNDYPTFFKRGTFFRKVKRKIAFSAEEISKLPSKHEVFKNPNLQIDRNVIELLDIRPLQKVTNGIEVLFYGANPI
jgi:tRNA(His) guanylyltransferase